MKKIFFLIAVTLLGLVWLGEKISAERMAAKLVRLRQQNADLAGLLQKRDRLSQQLRDTENSGKIVQEQIASTGAAATKPQNSLRATLPLGDWVGVKSWGFRGQATPQASIESALWAAAGGDLATLKKLVFVSDEARAKAAEILESLPASSRMAYPSPDDLISALTIKRVPLGEAQLVWLDQNGPDNANVCLVLKDPVNSSGVKEPELSVRRVGKRPPQRLTDPGTGVTYLSLQREGNRWQLVVPPASIQAMARELGVVTESGS